MIALDTAKITPWLGLRNSLGVMIPLLVGFTAGSLPAGLVVATGALNVSFSDGLEPYRQRGRRMLTASVLVGFAVMGGSLSGASSVGAIAVATLWALAAGLLVAFNTEAADLGVISLVTLTVFAANPQTPERAMYSGLLALGGGLLQTALSLLFWPVLRYTPERRAVGIVLTELARAAVAPAIATASPLASSATTQARQALKRIARDHSFESERLLSLLTQAERVRLGLLILTRLQSRLEREAQFADERSILKRFSEICSEILEAAGSSLTTGRPVESVADRLQEAQKLAHKIRAVVPADSLSPPAAMLRDGRVQMDALGGQLRSIVDLCASATPDGLNAFARRESTRPRNLRLAGAVATLRANLNLRSTACRHAIRLAACVCIGDALGRHFDLHRSYWIPMTIAIVLKPDFVTTFTRGVLRLAGTFLGLLIATGLFHIMPFSSLFTLALIAAVMFLLRCFGSANYGIFVTAVTALVVLLIAITGVSPKAVMLARGLNTAAGGSIALLAYLLWPTWERTLAPQALADMLDSYRNYFRMIRESYLQPETDFGEERDHLRQDARLARSNLEGSADRLYVEPGSSEESVKLMGGMLASSHRLIHAVMALEAGLSSSRPVPARSAFKTFCDDVELTMYYLAAALRGSALKREELPDLREDHTALTQSRDALIERHALVNVETDRLANSLNTLSEQVIQWIGQSPERKPESEQTVLQ